MLIVAALPCSSKRSLPSHEELAVLLKLTGRESFSEDVRLLHVSAYVLGNNSFGLPDLFSEEVIF